MPRVLAMSERRIGAVDRDQYLASLAQRRTAAVNARAHFWVFEHETESGRFVEFTEAGGDVDVAAALGHGAPASLWREVQGS